MISEARDLLMQGFSPPQISNVLGCGPIKIRRLLRIESPEWLPPDRLADVWRGSRATAARILTSLGFTYKTIAGYMGTSERAISNYLYRATPTGTPLIKIRLNREITGEQNEVIERGAYRVLDFGPSLGFVRLDNNTGIACHFAKPSRLQGNCELLSTSLFEVEQDGSTTTTE